MNETTCRVPRCGRELARMADGRTYCPDGHAQTKGVADRKLLAELDTIAEPKLRAEVLAAFRGCNDHRGS